MARQLFVAAALAAAAEDEVAETAAARPTTSGRAGCSRSPASRWRVTAASFSDHETLLSFKGIGAYTAGAIRSFAFGQRAAILDTNVARVLYRVFVGRGDIKAHKMRKTVGPLEALVPYKHVFDFNQALMDFGATICTARKPKCDACPMTRACTSFPRMGHRSLYDEVIVVVAAVIEEDGAFLDAPPARRPPRRPVGIPWRQDRRG